MKYALILPDGAADEPLPQLAGRTPLEAARIPNMDWVSLHGRLGRTTTVPPGFTPGTDVATLALLGYDPHVYYSGRAPIEAAARGLRAGPNELIFRCNFVTVLDGRMRDFTAGHIAQAEADRLIAELNTLVEAGEPALRGCAFHSGVSYRNLMIMSDAGDVEIRCTPPHDIPDQPVAEHQPAGRGAERVRAVMERAAHLIADHELNPARRRSGKTPTTGIWLWGQGQPRRLEPFAERFGVRAAVITGVDILRGLAVLSGMTLIRVPGATGYIDTDFAAKGAAAVRALDEYDMVIVHVEAADEAGHAGDAALKVRMLERIDAEVVGPVLTALRRSDDWRILIAPDHPTPVATKAHSAVAPPFCFAGQGVPAVERRPFSEAAALAGGFTVEPAHKLMELFVQPLM